MLCASNSALEAIVIDLAAAAVNHSHDLRHPQQQKMITQDNVFSAMWARQLF
jgi:hypothetical protein